MNASQLQRSNAPVSQVLGRYAQLVQAGLVYHASLTASTALTAPGTALGPLTISNPSGNANPVAAHILAFDLGLGAVPTAGANEVTIQIATAQGATLSSTSTANTNIINGNLSNSTGVVQAFSSGTSSAATKGFRNVGYVGDVATTSVMLNGQIEVEISGSIILMPGTFVTVNGVGTTPASFSVVCGFTYAEVPLS